MGPHAIQIRGYTLYAAASLVLLCHCGAAEIGVQAWVQRYSGIGDVDDTANAVVADSKGAAIIAGYTAAGFTGNDILVLKYSSAGTPLWTNVYNGPANGDDEAKAIGVDANDNVYVTGYSLDPNSNVYSWVTIAYSSAGTPLWTNFYAGATYSTPSALAVDAGGNVAVVGISDVGNSAAFATIKYSSAGTALWTNFYAGPRNSANATAVTFDHSGNICVTGFSYGTNGNDYATIMYTPGGMPLWTNRYNGPGNSEDQPTSITVDGNGNVFVTGYSYGTDFHQHYATVAYSGAGVPLWTNRYTGRLFQNDIAIAVAVDSGGNVYVTGCSNCIGSGTAWATIKYSNAGAPLWTNFYRGGSGGISVPYSLVVDGNSNICVTGTDGRCVTIQYSSSGAALWTNFYKESCDYGASSKAAALDPAGNIYVAGSVGGDCATLKYSSSGAPLWTNRYSGVGKSDNGLIALQVDSNGNACVAATSRGVGSGNDFAVVKYSSAGAPLWTNRYDAGNGNDQVEALAVDAAGNTYLTGASSGTNCGFPYAFATLKYSSSGTPLWTNRFSGPGHDDVPAAIDADASGNAYVTGDSAGALGYSGGCATIKYASDGTPLWTNLFTGGFGRGLKVDGLGNFFVGGIASGTNGGFDYVILKYTTDGTLLWTNRYAGAGSSTDAGFAGMALASDGHVLITGGAYATVSYNTVSGLLVWANTYSSASNNFSEVNSIATDAQGNVYVTGRAAGFNGGTDWATISYAGSGFARWTNIYHGTLTNSDETAVALAVDGNGNVYVTGGVTSVVVIKYSSAGIPLWTNSFSASAHIFDLPTCIAVTQNGSLIVGANSTGAQNGTYDATVIKYVSGVPPSLGPPVLRPDRNFQFLLTGSSNQTTRIESTTNLANPPLWSTLAIVTNQTGTTLVSDLHATNSSVRFYRAVWLP